MIGTRLYPGHEATKEESSTLEDKIDGSYWKQLDTWNGITKVSWHCVTPNGLHGWLFNHKVIENEDGTITVPRPGPGEGANSILVGGQKWRPTGKSWHGFITNGVWEPC